MNPRPFTTGGGSGGSFEEIPFLITGDTDFGPFYPPDRIKVSKERNLNRNQSMCSGEDVTDNGSKNREIHVSGVIRKSEVSAFNSLLDEEEPLDLITAGFSGEIHVRQGDFEGPVRWDPEHNEWLYEYSVDLLSTGREEDDNNGIIDDGSSGGGGGGGGGMVMR